MEAPVIDVERCCLRHGYVEECKNRPCQISGRRYDMNVQIDISIWQRLYHAAEAVQNDRRISDYVEAGGVSAAILSSSGRIYTGVCVDTCSTLGICAERNAIFNMLTNGEQEIVKVLAIMLTPEWWV